MDGYPCDLGTHDGTAGPRGACPFWAKSGALEKSSAAVTPTRTPLMRMKID